jgi:hypothetical protein
MTRSRHENGALLAWVRVNGRPTPQKWSREYALFRMGRHPIAVAKRELSDDEIGWSLAELAAKYPAPREEEAL